jgi:hypothetical protein
MEPLDENTRVDARSDADLERWSSRLKVSKEELRKAAERVGPRLGDIRQHLVGGFNNAGPTS